MLNAPVEGSNCWKNSSVGPIKALMSFWRGGGRLCANIFYIFASSLHPLVVNGEPSSPPLGGSNKIPQ